MRRVHGLQAHRSDRARAPEVREAVLEMAVAPVYTDFGPTLLAKYTAREAAALARTGRDRAQAWSALAEMLQMCPSAGPAFAATARRRSRS